MTKAEKTIWTTFIEELKKAIEYKEPMEAFMELMHDNGFRITKQSIDRRLLIEQSREIGTHFNAVCGNNYDVAKFPNKTSLLIERQLLNGYSVEDCKRVILMMNDRWRNGPFHVHLRIDIIFDDNKFFNYKSQLPPLPGPKVRSSQPGNVPANPPPRQLTQISKPRDRTTQDQCQDMLEFITELYLFDHNKGQPYALRMLTGFVWDHFSKIGQVSEAKFVNMREAAAKFALDKLEELKKVEEVKIEKYVLELYCKYYYLKKLFKGKELKYFLNLINPSQFQPITQQS